MGKARRDEYLKKNSISLTNFLPGSLITGRVIRGNGIAAIPRKNTDDFVLLFMPREAEIFPLIDLSEGETFVDVGANVGYYSLKLSSKLGNSIRVIAVEAHPDTFNALCKNIEVNRFTNIIPINKAVADRKGTVSLYERLGLDDVVHTGGSTINTNIGTYHRAINVDCDMLDNILAQYDPNVLKVDVEGAEVLALKGARQTLKLARKVIVEIHDDNLDGVKSILSDSGFVTRELVSDGMKYVVAERSLAK